MDLLDRMDIESLHNALKKGDMVLTDTAPGGETTSITAITLVNAPPQRVWDVVTDYEAYATFAPLINQSRVRERKGNKVVVEFVAGVKVAFLPINGRIVLAQTHHPIERIDYKRAGGSLKMMEGCWRILEVDSGKKSIMCCKVSADLRDINKAIRFLLERVPFLIGPLLYAGIGIVGDAVKKRIERG